MRNAGADGVVVVFVIGGGQRAALKRRDYWLHNVGTAVEGWYRPHFYDVYTARDGAGWSERQNNLLLETVYADVRRVERVWSMVTETDDLEFQDLVARLADRIVDQMKSMEQI